MSRPPLPHPVKGDAAVNFDNQRTAGHENGASFMAQSVRGAMRMRTDTSAQLVQDKLRKAVPVSGRDGMGLSTLAKAILVVAFVCETLRLSASYSLRPCPWCGLQGVRATTTQPRHSCVD